MTAIRVVATCVLSLILFLLSWAQPLCAHEPPRAPLSSGPQRLLVELIGPSDAHVTTHRVGKLRQARAGHTATLRPDGRVLFTGGRGEHGILGSAELFDPRTLQGVLLGAPLTSPRTEHSATLMPTGEVLLAAGRDASGLLFSTELGLPDGTFGGLASNVQIPRAGHSATLLPDGRVVILGGFDASRLVVDEGETFDVPSGVLYDPRSGAFTLLPRALVVPRHNHTATLLPDGRVLVVGGRHEDEILRSAELFDPTTGESRVIAARLRTGRLRHTASLLNDGRVLIAGGRSRREALDSVEVLDPAGRSFSLVNAKLRRARFSHTATVLPNGVILLAGGREDEEDDRERHARQDNRSDDRQDDRRDDRKGPTRHMELYVPPWHDTTPPTVLEIHPAPGATDVSLTPLIAIRFSEPIDVTTLTERTLSMTGPASSGAPDPVSGTVSPGEEGLLAFFVPAAPLSPGRYTLTLEGLTDRAGHSLASVTSDFTTVGEPPVLSAFSPASGVVGTTVFLTGKNFDPEPAANEVRFSGVVAVVTAATATSITTAVPDSATTGPISVTTANGTAVSDTDFTVLTAPVIFGVSPTSGAIGSPVTITGTGFDPAPGATIVTFGGDAVATVTSATLTELRVTVPASAETGPISVRTALGTAQGPEFKVLREQDFELTVNPGALVVLQGSGTVAQVELSSTGTQTFTGLAALSVEGLPAGVTAVFEPRTLSGFQTGTLRLTASGAATLGPFPLSVRGERGTLVRRAPLALTVQANTGTTGVQGRFVTPEGPGIAGVIVRADTGTGSPPQTTSDAAGNFLLTDLPAGQVTLRLDSTPADPGYPIWGHTLELSAGQIVTLQDWIITPPPTADRFTTINNATQDQVVTDARYPGLEIRLPAGVTIVGWDGVPKTRLAVERLEPDKLPISPPPIPTKSVYQIFWGTPMGGIPSQPIPVTLPNDINLEPGERTELWYYDAPPIGGEGVWRIGGTGTASADGKVIRTDPGSGIPRFCGVCGMPCFKANQASPPKQPPPSNQPPCQACGQSVTLATGQELVQEADVVIHSVPAITIGRAFNPFDPFNNIANTSLSLGLGWTLSLDVALLPFSAELTRVVLPGNDRIDFTPDGSGGFVNRTDSRFDGARLTAPSGNVWELRYKNGGLWRFAQLGLIHLLTEQRDTNGNSLLVTRGSNGKITSIQAGQRSLAFTYGPNGFITEIRDPLGRTTSYTYTAQNRIETVTEPDAAVTRYTYADDAEFPPTAACPSVPGGVRLTSTRLPGRAQAVTQHYGPARRVLRETREDGSEISFSYTLVGACVTHVSSPGTRCTGPSCPIVDSWDNLQAGWRISGGSVVATSCTNPSGHSYQQRFDSSGLGKETTDAQGQTFKYERDTNNRTRAVTDPLNRTWRYEYDAQGNKTRVADPAGRITDYTYDAKWNRVTSMTRIADNRPVVRRLEYDPNTGNLIRGIDPLGHATTYAYDSRGLLTAVTDALNRVQRLVYNDAGDLTKLVDALGNETTLTRDEVGRLTATTDPLGTTSHTVYNAVNQITQTTDAQGGLTALGYGPKRDLTSITNPLDRVIESYSRDDRLRLQSKTDAKSKPETYAYTPGGLPATLTDRAGQTTAFSYDERSRLTLTDYPDAQRRFSYDAVGRLVTVEDETAGSVSYRYDNLDRIERETQENGGVTTTLDFEYDALDRRTKRTVNGADVTTFVYDDADRLVQIGYRGQTTLYVWDEVDRLRRKTLPNGIVAEYSYDGADRLLEIQYRRSDSTLLETVGYTYDANGNRTIKTTGRGSVRETSLEAAYDEANRMTTITLSPGTPEARSYALAYDDNGSLLSKTEQGNPANLTTYGWDSRNRLKQLRAPGYDATFKYDGLNRRVERVVNGRPTRYVYDGPQAIMELTDAGPTNLLTGVDVDEVIGRYSQSGSAVYLTDALGSVLAQTQADQSVQNFYAYTPYGETQTLGADGANSLQYTGRENDQNELYYYRARYYDPELKRFLSEDPIGVAGGHNAYVYVDGAPSNLIDPTGFASVCYSAGPNCSGAGAGTIYKTTPGGQCFQASAAAVAGGGAIQWKGCPPPTPGSGCPDDCPPPPPPITITLGPSPTPTAPGGPPTGPLTVGPVPSPDNPTKDYIKCLAKVAGNLAFFEIASEVIEYKVQDNSHKAWARRAGAVFKNVVKPLHFALEAYEGIECGNILGKDTPLGNISLYPMP